VAKRLQIKQKATEKKSHIFVRNHKTEFLEHTYRYIFLPKWDMASFPSLASQVARHWYLKLNF